MKALLPAQIANRPSRRQAIRDAVAAGFTKAEAIAAYRETAKDEIFINDLYQVNRRELGNGVTHLSIKRRDKDSVTDWRHKQQIKNQLCGPEREGIELYPAESRLVDTANQYHLWILPEGERLPIGFESGRRVSSHEGENQKQRPLDSE